jgi:hypothetical protein
MTGRRHPDSAKPDDAKPETPNPTGEEPAADEHWLVIDWRRWRRTDPELADEVAAALRSHLGRARAAVRAAKRSGDEDELHEARRRVGLAKTGLGERGPRWWEEPIADRRRRASEALQSLADD